MASKNTWKQFPHQVELSREESVVKEGEKTIPFLRRLIDMLQENEEVISFFPGAYRKNGQTTAGRIVVHDRSRVESEILPRYFNHASFASLRRQLNYFCFSRVGKGKQRGATYCNEQVIELNDILRLKRRVAGSATQSTEHLKESKTEEMSQSNQQPSLQRESTVQPRPQPKLRPAKELSLREIRKKYHNSRVKKKRRRILNSIVPVVHLTKAAGVKELTCCSKEQIYDDQATVTVSPPTSINGNTIRSSLSSKPIQNTLSVAQHNLCVLPSPNGNFEMFKKKCIPSKFAPNLSTFDVSKNSTNLSIPRNTRHKKETDILDGCASALLSLSYL